MAVPKKKVSHSKRRKRLLTGFKNKASRIYKLCPKSLNFVLPHRYCPFSENTTKVTPNNRINNITKLYDVNF